ncbi:hypothetical protein HELRODRAFT_66618, partial [Helobdella robusta]|uniref:SLED domain-containing protein n=1 Tax=Helobdella robusta TaxID=6412 RepID=T1FYN1_HELRO
DDTKFVWDDYLESCQAIAAPSALFKHVECSLQNGLKKGMVVEVANKNPAGTFWVSIIVMSCGQLLMLKPACCNDDDSSFNFWCDMSTCDVKQTGWCRNTGNVLAPPADLIDKIPKDYQPLLEKLVNESQTPSLQMLEQKTGYLPFDQIEIGMYFEVQHQLEPLSIWFVQVVQNLGGRLLLHYSCDHDHDNDFWLFYTDLRLHPIGWCRSDDGNNGRMFAPPKYLIDKYPTTNWLHEQEECYKVALNKCSPLDVFKDQDAIEEHGFEEGWRLEMLDEESSTFHVAHVAQVVNKNYFIIQSDVFEVSATTDALKCCHFASTNIFPMNWCKENGFKLQPIPGQSGEFDWDDYLQQIAGTPASPDCFFQPVEEDLRFEEGMKLEVVNPNKNNQLCAATIDKVKCHLLSIKLDHTPSVARILPWDSHEIFPIGWCESNNYPLKAPTRKTLPSKDVNSESSFKNELEGYHWCSKIYFNTTCYSGPYLHKSRLNVLPKSVGPGPVINVMITVLTKLIGCAYKSSRVLRELQLEGPAKSNMHHQVLRTRYKMKNYSATVDICMRSNQIDSYCRDVCRRLLCCPNLISTHLYPLTCPENCLKLARSKHYHHFGEKKRKIGRPRGGHSNIEGDVDETTKKPKEILRKIKLIFNQEQIGEDRSYIVCGGDVESSCGDRSDDVSVDGEMGVDEDSRSSSAASWAGRSQRKRSKKSTFIDDGDWLDERKLKRKKNEVKNYDTNASENIVRSTNKQKDSSLKLLTNPEKWDVMDVVEYIKTTDCSKFARIFKEQEIDGRSLLLLDLPTVQFTIEPKLGPAVKLCDLVENIKGAYFKQFSSVITV